MRSICRTCALAIVAFSTLAALAHAALPQRGRTYVGSTSLTHKRVSITVDQDRTRGHLTYCGYTVPIHIVGDHFGVHKVEADGQVSVFRIHGSWKTPKLVSGKVDLNFGCDGRPGDWTATLRG